MNPTRVAVVLGFSSGVMVGFFSIRTVIVSLMLVENPENIVDPGKDEERNEEPEPMPTIIPVHEIMREVFNEPEEESSLPTSLKDEE